MPLATRRWYVSRFAPTVALSVALSVVLCIVCASTARGENWPGWRGPRGDGTSAEQSAPVRWDGPSGRGIEWKVELPGVGHSSAVVWEDRLFVTTCLPEPSERLLLCLDRASGSTLWRRSVLSAPVEKMHRLNSPASGTPATDGERVYVTFLAPDGPELPDPNHKKKKGRTPGDMVVAAFTFAGEPIWSVRPGRFASVHGYCSSPVLYGSTVIVNGDHDGDGYLVALDRKTGRTRWKVDRDNKTRSYVTPLIRTIDGREQLILSGSKAVASFDPRNGKRHWNIDGPTEQYVASLVYNGELLFMTAGFPDRHILAIRPDGSGNVTDSHIAWRTTRGCSYVPSPIAAGDAFLVVSDSGIATQFEAASGRVQWTERIGRGYSASLVSAAGLVYFTSDDGVTKVVRPGEKFDLVAENELGEACYGSPAISDGHLYLRGERHLWAIDGNPAGGPADGASPK